MKITSIITKSSADNLGLREGREAYAGIKATSVMLASD
ncbi:MAG TPA: TOBE domain-containing protein [Methanosarcina sp.]|nr:TOBE domain-containing protein [Methanosarcina sp.]